MKIKPVFSRLTLPVLALSFAEAQAATYYVSTTGSDSNPGPTKALLKRLAERYYDICAGIGDYKTPEVYGTFPMEEHHQINYVGRFIRRLERQRSASR